MKRTFPSSESLFRLSLSPNPHLSTHSFPDLLEPHILRSLSNVPVVSIHSSCSGNHFVAIDTAGDAWLFGRNTSSALGVEGIESVSENAPVKLRMASLIAAGQGAGGKRGAKEALAKEAAAAASGGGGGAGGGGGGWASAACGRNHTILVGKDGSVWTAGANTYGQVRMAGWVIQMGLTMLIVWSSSHCGNNGFQANPSC
jgi:hypothetical protein